MQEDAYLPLDTGVYLPLAAGHGMCLDVTAKGVLATSKVRSMSLGDSDELEPALSPAGLSRANRLQVTQGAELSRSANSHAGLNWGTPCTIQGDADSKALWVPGRATVKLWGAEAV